MKRSIGICAIVGTFLAVGCGSAAQENDASSADQDIVATDPLLMPAPVVKFLATNNWGKHHLQWHTVRQWDLLEGSDQAYAKRQGWTRASIQEGQKGNGLEFLAMHRVMIGMLTTQFAADKSLFAGWQSPPTNPSDGQDPIPSSTTEISFDPNMADAIDKLMNHLADFASDDDLGIFLETTLRPTPDDPHASSDDATTGLHNYIHNRFSDSKSKIDMGDPSVNLQNKRFWRLHGWIESRWTEFRSIKGLSNEDPSYEAAIKAAQTMLAPANPRTVSLAAEAPEEEPPMSLRKFFENQH